MKNLIILFILATVVSCDNQNRATNTGGQENTNQHIDSVAFSKALALGAMHKLLASMAGIWNTEETFWWNDTTAVKSTGTCESKMILGGRYLQSTLTYKYPGKDSSFVGISIMGYDNDKMVFESSWEENITTGMIYSEGTMDSASKTITLISHYNDHMGDVVFRQAWKLVDSMHEAWDCYVTEPGKKEVKVFEMKMTKH